MDSDDPHEPVSGAPEEFPESPSQREDRDDDSEGDFQDPIELITEFGNNPLMERSVAESSNGC